MTGTNQIDINIKTTPLLGSNVLSFVCFTAPKVGKKPLLNNLGSGFVVFITQRKL